MSQKWMQINVLYQFGWSICFDTTFYGAEEALSEVSVCTLNRKERYVVQKVNVLR